MTCSNLYCVLKMQPGKGQGTSGACHCLDDVPRETRMEIRQVLHQLKEENKQLGYRISTLEGQLEQSQEIASCCGPLAGEVDEFWDHLEAVVNAYAIGEKHLEERWKMEMEPYTWGIDNNPHAWSWGCLALAIQNARKLINPE